MEKKTIIGIAVIVAVLAVVGGLIAVGMVSNNTENSKNVTYDGNGGTCEGSSTVTNDSSVIPELKWTNTGYSFVSYNDKKDGSGTTYKVGDSAPFGKTLYAQYVKSTSMKISLKDMPDYMEIFCNGKKVSNGDVFDDDDCKFTVITSASGDYTIENGLLYINVVKDEAVVGTLSYDWHTHGGEISVNSNIQGSTWRLVVSNLSELTLIFTPSS